jgi:hypothetical protein
MTPANDGKSNDLYGALAGIGLVVLVVIMLVVTLLRLANELGPQIGAIIAFEHVRTELNDTQVRIVALRIGESSPSPCMLDVHVMLMSGGSLLIDAIPFDSDRRVRVHWIGARTSDGVNDCGAAADLLLTREDIAALTVAASGSHFTDK